MYMERLIAEWLCCEHTEAVTRLDRQHADPEDFADELYEFTERLAAHRQAGDWWRLAIKNSLGYFPFEEVAKLVRKRLRGPVKSATGWRADPDHGGRLAM
jgi:hypothetical protein